MGAWVFIFLLKMYFPGALWTYSHYHINHGKHLTQNKSLQQSHSVMFLGFDLYPINFTDAKWSRPDVHTSKTNLPHLQIWLQNKPGKSLTIQSYGPYKKQAVGVCLTRLCAFLASAPQGAFPLEVGPMSPWGGDGNGWEWVNLTQMTIISTAVGKNPLEEME